jgi:hypothetical protein
LATSSRWVHDLCEEHALGQREQRVEPVVARRGERDLLLAVLLAALVFGERAAAVIDAPDVPVGVHLEDVPAALVHHQPAHDEVRIVAQGQDGLGVAVLCHQLLGREPERQLLDAALAVRQERVVHVEADLPDLVHAHVAVHEDSPGRLQHRSPEDGVERVGGTCHGRREAGSWGGY